MAYRLPFFLPSYAIATLSLLAYLALPNVFVLFPLLCLALYILHPRHRNLWELGPGLLVSLCWLLVYQSEQALPFGALNEMISCTIDKALHGPFLWSLALVHSHCPFSHFPLGACSSGYSTFFNMWH